MKYAPISAVGMSAAKIINGSPVRSSDLQHIDRYQTWLAAVRKHQPPAITFPAGFSTGSIELTVAIPSFTRGVFWEILAVGDGMWKCSCPMDSYFTRITTSNSNGTGIDGAVLYSSGGSKDATANGQRRAIDITVSDSWASTTFTLTAESVAGTDAVYMWRLVFLPPLESEVLP